MKALFAGLPCVLVLGCGGSGEGAQPDGAAPAATPTVPGLEIEGDVVSPAEAAAEAERAITPENADEELEKLSREIEGG